MTSNLHRVVWAKGMLLTPQHFQSHSNYIEDTLQFRFGASCFANWGVMKKLANDEDALVYDEEALAKGQFTLMRFTGLLPDGTAVDCPTIHSAPPTRPFAQYFTPGQDLLDVYLAVPGRIHGQNVNMNGEADASANVRYTARLTQVRDENGLDEDRPVQLAHCNLAILFGNQQTNGYGRLRIAQIARSPTGQFGLNPEFVPPLLNVAASPALMRLIKRQVEILGTKSQSLSSARRQRGKTLADFTTSESASFWLLHTVNSFLPELIHVWTVRRGHPEPLYLAMLKMAGALSTFSLEDDARTLPQYDHDNLGPCFAALDARIRDLLETVIPSRCISIPLRQNQRLWSGTITDDRWVKSSQLYFAAAGDLGVDEIIRRVPQLVKIAAPDEINNLVSHALPALGLRHVSPPPSAVPFRVENQYFSVNQAGRLWEGIVRSRAISIYMPPELTGARPELFVLLP